MIFNYTTLHCTTLHYRVEGVGHLPNNNYASTPVEGGGQLPPTNTSAIEPATRLNLR